MRLLFFSKSVPPLAMRNGGDIPPTFEQKISDEQVQDILDGVKAEAVWVLLSAPLPGLSLYSLKSARYKLFFEIWKTFGF